ncbi:hypothetical protein Fcan01_17748 [Folsomia candida]|uniref:Uncharacterized protein n=1 Tax=Folsomia candida TaxID=158441 RepID=A0A226DPR9_FOLCA|nr:hypothetical protein Fcan01_17748 [Folsomia candida]
MEEAARLAGKTIVAFSKLYRIPQISGELRVNREDPEKFRGKTTLEPRQTPEQRSRYKLKVKVWTYILHYLALNLAQLYLGMATSPLFGQLDTGYFLMTSISPTWPTTWHGMAIRLVVAALLGYHWFCKNQAITYPEFFVAVTIFNMVIILVSTSTELLRGLEEGMKPYKMEYDCIRILLFKSNQVLRWVFGVGVDIISIQFVVSVNVSLKFREKMPLMVYVIFPLTAGLLVVVAVVLVSFGGRAMTWSQAYVQKWSVLAKSGGGGERRKYEIRVWRAVQPVGVEVGSFGCFDKMSILSLFAVWLDQSVALLLV